MGAVSAIAAGYPVGVAEGRPPGGAVLHVVRRGERSVVSRACAASPLRLLTPRNHGTAAWVYTATYGGGLVDGDALRLDIDVGPDAMAMVSTQASTKVYRSPSGTSAELNAAVAHGALLALLPDPVVCFAASRYRQVQRLHLHPTASLVMVDWLSSGRRASGERWVFDSYSSRLTIRCADRLVLLDALSLCADHGTVAARMGRFDVLCLVVIIGQPLAAPINRAMCRVSERPVQKRADVLVAASPVSDVGCLVRIAGGSVEEVAGVAREYVSFLPLVLGDDPWARKW
jgi:urease accessory protein